MNNKSCLTFQNWIFDIFRSEDSPLETKDLKEHKNTPATEEEEFPFKEDDDYKAIETKTLSFRSNRSMWENIEKGKEKSQTLDHPRKHHSSQPVVAPDLLKDLLGKSLVRRPGVKISSGRVSPDGLGQEKQ